MEARSFVGHESCLNVVGTDLGDDDDAANLATGTISASGAVAGTARIMNQDVRREFDLGNL